MVHGVTCDEPCCDSVDLLALRAQFASRSANLQPAPAPDDPVRTLVSRLELEKYKATIKGLTQFGDRRQGTDRNRAAIDWIEAQLKSYGCTNTERLKYDYQPEPTDSRARTWPWRPRRHANQGTSRTHRRQQRSDAPA